MLTLTDWFKDDAEWEESEKRKHRKRLFICYFCGADSSIAIRYLDEGCIKHHLHCGFLKLPEDKEFIKTSVKPVSTIRSTVIYRLIESHRFRRF